MKKIVGLFVILVLTVVSAGCSSISAPRTQTLTLAHGLTVTVPPGVKVSAKADAVADKELRRYTKLIAPLAPVADLSSSHIPAGGAVLTFHIDPHRIAPGTKPFLAWLDAAGIGHPVASSYDDRAGTVSARVPHFSRWVPLDWVTSRMAALLTGVFESMYGLAGSPIEGDYCGNYAAYGSNLNPLSVSDSNPQQYPHKSLSYCGASGGKIQGAFTKFNSLKAYPVDLIYPSFIRGSCDEFGPCVQGAAEHDPWVKLGAELSSSFGLSHQILLPGFGQASIFARIGPGQSATFTTMVDVPALFMGFLEGGVKVFAQIMSLLRGPASALISAVVDALDGSTCVRDGWTEFRDRPLSLVAAKDLGSAAFSCVSLVLPKVLKKLGFKLAAFAISAFGAVLSLLPATIGSIFANIDNLTGAAHHVIMIHYPSNNYSGPTLIAQGQNIADPLDRPVSGALSGDATFTFSGMTWSVWNSTEAVGTGVAHLEDCNPSCAGGGQYAVPVIMKFSKPVKDCTGQYGSGSVVLGGDRYFYSQVYLSFPDGLNNVPVAARLSQNPWIFSVLIPQANQSCGT